MEWINYHHLLYFWVVAREGSVVQASRELLLAQPTLSGQIRALENSLGEKLFQKSGRKLILTDVGRVVYRYADEIFTLGREMTDALRGRTSGRPVRFLAQPVQDSARGLAHSKSWRMFPCARTYAKRLGARQSPAALPAANKVKD